VTQSAETMLSRPSGETTQSGHAMLRRSLAGGLVTALPVVVIGLAVLGLAPAYYTHLALAAFVNLIVVVGLQVFMGNSNIANLGHSAFVGIGAYGVAILSTPLAMKKLSIPNAPFGLALVELNPLLAAVLALLAVGILAAISGKIISRLSGVAATIVSLALLIIVHSVFLNWTDLFKGNQAFFGIPKVVDLPAMLVASVVVIVIARLFKDSRWGLQLRASAQSPQAAAAFGVDARRLRLGAWVLSALICGLAGVLFAYFAGTISPKHADPGRHGDGDGRGDRRHRAFDRPRIHPQHRIRRHHRRCPAAAAARPVRRGTGCGHRALHGVPPRRHQRAA
jgi:branched-chain amino acid transport system permease protein